MKTKKYTFRSSLAIEEGAMAQSRKDTVVPPGMGDDFVSGHEYKMNIGNVNPLAELLGRYPQVNTQLIGEPDKLIYESEVSFGRQLSPADPADAKSSLLSIEERTDKPPAISRAFKMKVPPVCAALLKKFDPNYWLGDAFYEIIDVEFALQPKVGVTPADTTITLERYDPFNRDDKNNKIKKPVAKFDALKGFLDIEWDAMDYGYAAGAKFESSTDQGVDWFRMKTREPKALISFAGMVAWGGYSPQRPEQPSPPQISKEQEAWDAVLGNPADDVGDLKFGAFWKELFQLNEIKPNEDRLLTETPPSHYHYFELPTPAFLADASPPDPLAPDLVIDQFRPTQEDRIKFDTFGRYNYLVKSLEAKDILFTASYGPATGKGIASVVRPSSYYGYKIAKYYHKLLGIGKNVSDVINKGSYNWKFDLLSRASQNPNDWMEFKGYYQNYVSLESVAQMAGIGGFAKGLEGNSAPPPMKKFEKTFEDKISKEVDPTPGESSDAYNIMVNNNDYYFVRDDPFLKDVYANRNYLPFYNEIYCSFERSNSLLAEPFFSKTLEEFKLRDTFLFNLVSNGGTSGPARADIGPSAASGDPTFSVDADDADFISGKGTYVGLIDDNNLAGSGFPSRSYLNVIKTGDRLGEYLKFFFTDGATNPAILNKNAAGLKPDTLNELVDRWWKQSRAQHDLAGLDPVSSHFAQMFVTNPFYGGYTETGQQEITEAKKPQTPLVMEPPPSDTEPRQLKYRNFVSLRNKTTGGEPQKSKLFKALMLNKFNQIVKDNQLDFWDSLQGKRNYAEVVGYSIERIRIAVDQQGDEQHKTEKEMFFPIDIDGEQALNIIDSDVYYDTDYYYKFHYHVISLGVATAYHQILGFDGNATKNDSKTTLKFGCVSYPDLRMFKTQVGQSNVINIYDRPPVFPVIRAIPYKDKPNEVGFLFQNNSDRLKAEPIAIFKKDEALFAKARVNQKAMEGEAKSREAWEVTNQMASSMFSWVGQSSKQGYNLEFATISDLTKVEMFRLDKEPKEYADFKDAKLQIIHLDQTTGFIDKVETNKKYWYTFRTVNWHGLVSNPTAIYQVELIEHDAVRLPQIKLFEFRSPKRKEVYEFNSLLHIALSPEQMMVTDVSKANSADATTLALSDGTASQKTNLFTNKKKGKNKYIKLRLTSKSTGKAVDINLIPTLEALNYTLPPVQGFGLEKFGDLSFGDQQDIKKYFDLNFKSTNELFTRDYDDYGVSPKLINKLSDMLEHKGLDKLAVLSLIENFEKLRNKEDD